MSARAVPLLLTVVLAAARPPDAAAQDAGAAAATHFKAGKKHYLLSEYTQALQQFREGFRNREDPVFLYNIAQCHRMLGDSREALTYYRRYLAMQPTADNREEVQKHIRALEQAPGPPPPPAPAAVTPPAAVSTAPGVTPAAAPPPTGAPEAPHHSSSAWPFPPAQGTAWAPGAAPAPEQPQPAPIAVALTDDPPGRPAPGSASPSLVGSSSAAVPLAADKGRPVAQQVLFWAIVGGLAIVGITALVFSRPEKADPCQGIAPCRTLY